MPCHSFAVGFERTGSHRISASAWLETGTAPLFRIARRGVLIDEFLEEVLVFVIGIDPHKASHTAAVLDDHERLVSEVRVHADRAQRDRLLAFAAEFEPRCWAIEGATG